LFAWSSSWCRSGSAAAADEVVTIYEPEPGGWTARVRWVKISGHTYYRSTSR
jgi:hypothetical protein